MEKGKYNPKMHKLIVEALKRGTLVTDACALAGIGTSTFYQWLARGRKGEEKYVAFERACTKAEAQAVDNAMKTVQRAVNNKDWKAAAWFLSKRRPEVFGDRLQVEDVHKRMAREMTPEDRQALLREAGYVPAGGADGSDDSGGAGG